MFTSEPFSSVLIDLRLPRPSRWRGVRQPHPSVTGQEVPEVNRYERECFERPEVGLLALRRLDVIGLAVTWQ